MRGDDEIIERLHEDKFRRNGGKTVLAFGLQSAYHFMNLPGSGRGPLHLAAEQGNMAKKRAAARPSKADSEERASVTPERFARLHLLLTLLARSPQTREVLARKLKLDVRGFYRDLDVLRHAGITVVLQDSQYQLSETFAVARTRLPFPDPRLTLGEVSQLAKGRTPAHRHLKALLDRHLA